MLNEIEVNIGGYNYGVRFDNLGTIHETKCETRWTWCSSSTGDLWLDEQLKKAVDRWLNS